MYLEAGVYAYFIYKWAGFKFSRHFSKTWAYGMDQSSRTLALRGVWGLRLFISKRRPPLPAAGALLLTLDDADVFLECDLFHAVLEPRSQCRKKLRSCTTHKDPKVDVVGRNKDAMACFIGQIVAFAQI